MKVTEGVFAYPWTNMMENNCNTYVLQGDGLVLIDPGLKRYVPDICDAMRADGLNPDDIRLVMCTHGHPDHLDGVTHFASAGVTIALHGEEIKFLEEIGKDFFRMFGLPEPQFSVGVSMQAGDLDTNGLHLQIFHTPGHSPGSVCIYWPDKQVLISGDVVFSGSIGRTDFPGGSGHTLKESIEKIAALKVEYLLPGHNEIVQGAQQIAGNFDFIKRSFFSFL
jgi:hydroxyacylglutathione hydrolase